MDSQFLEPARAQHIISTGGSTNLYQYLNYLKTRRPLLKQIHTAAPHSNSITVSRAPNGSLVPYIVPYEATTKGPTEQLTINTDSGQESITTLHITPSPSRGKRGKYIIKIFHQPHFKFRILAIPFIRFPDTDRIIFPTEMEALTTSMYENQEMRRYTSKGYRKKPPVPMSNRFGHQEDRFVPKACPDGSIICDHTDYYPAEVVNRIVATNIAYQYADVFGDDIVPEVVQRVDYPDEEALCHSKETIIYPKVVKRKIILGHILSITQISLKEFEWNSACK